MLWDKLKLGGRDKLKKRKMHIKLGKTFFQALNIFHYGIISTYWEVKDAVSLKNLRFPGKRCKTIHIIMLQSQVNQSKKLRNSILIYSSDLEYDILNAADIRKKTGRYFTNLSANMC